MKLTGTFNCFIRRPSRESSALPSVLQSLFEQSSNPRGVFFSLDADWGQLIGSTEKAVEGSGNTAKSQATAFSALNNGEQLVFYRTKLVIILFLNVEHF